MKNISYDQAMTLLKDKSTMLIDVQEKDDYYKRHLINSINIPVEKINLLAEEYIKDKRTSLIVYCLHGIRSVAACDMLERKGYSNVYNILGGIQER